MTVQEAIAEAETILPGHAAPEGEQDRVVYSGITVYPDGRVKPIVCIREVCAAEGIT